MGSAKFKVNFNLPFHSGFLAYSIDNLWFDTQVLKQFITDSDRIFDDFQCELNDLSNYFILKIAKVNYDFHLSLNIYKPMIATQGEVKIQITSIANYELVKRINESLKAFA